MEKKKRVKPIGSGRKKGVGSVVRRIPKDKIEKVDQILYGPVTVKMKP